MSQGKIFTINTNMNGVIKNQQTNKWRATLYGNGENHYLGEFPTEEIAQAKLLKAKKAVAGKLRTTRKDNVTGYVGISYSKVYRTYRVCEKGRYIGTFKTLADAVVAHKSLAKGGAS